MYILHQENNLSKWNKRCHTRRTLRQRKTKQSGASEELIYSTPCMTLILVKDTLIQCWMLILLPISSKWNICNVTTNIVSESLLLMTIKKGSVCQLCFCVLVVLEKLLLGIIIKGPIGPKCMCGSGLLLQRASTIKTHLIMLPLHRLITKSICSRDDIAETTTYSSKTYITRNILQYEQCIEKKS